MNAQTLVFTGAKSVDHETCLRELRECIEAGQQCLVVTGEAGSGLSSIVYDLIQNAPCEHVAHIAAVSTRPQDFLQRLLSQLGFEPFAATSGELLKLLNMFLQYESAQQRRTLLIVEHANRFGPHVLDLLQILLGLEGADGPPVTLLMTGRNELARVLDSPGMEAVAPLTEARWQLEPGAAADDRLTRTLLISRDGKLVGHLPLNSPRLLIGRHRQNDLVLEGEYVSRHHAILTTGPDCSMLVDLNSTNGTYVNSVAIKYQDLHDGDVINIGSYRLKYVAPDLRKASPTARDHPDETGEVPSLAGIVARSESRQDDEELTTVAKFG
ncbi:MAG: FHA domain-containing protein [Gammaproteobacteria bacterium]|nr:FHA domain-containing protein [Gammaproteobacteria bacterium]